VNSGMHKMSENSLISNLLADGFDANRLLSRSSQRLYDLDKESVNILSILARTGTCNYQEIAQVGFHHNIDRFMVKRRIEGTAKFDGLEPLGFVKVKRGRRRYNKEEQKFSLTLKGFMASLSKVAFEDNYLVKHFYEFITSWSNNDVALASVFVQCMKFDLALFMLQHRISGINLTSQTNTADYITHWNESNPMVVAFYTSTQPSTNRISVQLLAIVRHRFYIAQLLLGQFLKNRTARTSRNNLGSESQTQQVIKVERNVDLIWCLRKWARLLETLQFESVATYYPNTMQFEVEDLSFEISLSELAQKATKILNAVGVDKPEFTGLPYIWTWFPNQSEG
jgi:hypothetical protein